MEWKMFLSDHRIDRNLSYYLFICWTSNQMKLGSLEIHLSDERLDEQRHKERDFIEQWKKDALFLGITWTWAIMWVSEIYSKNDKLYLIPNWMGVYEIIDSDLHNLKKVNA